MRISDWSSDVCSSDLRFLDPILRGDLWFCQGFSEPQSGSDLASVRTRAVRDGDHYIVSGQKTWTTAGHMADFMICLCRTNPDVKPQAGLSMLLLPLDAPKIGRASCWDRGCRDV